jgi:hypothetical protein
LLNFVIFLHAASWQLEPSDLICGQNPDALWPSNGLRVKPVWPQRGMN